MPGPAPA